MISLFIIAVLKRLEILLVSCEVDCHLKNPFLITLVELFGNTPILRTCKVTVPIKVGRVVGKISTLKALLK
jgi:hypothetical protein